MESNRQKKIASLLQKDLAGILQAAITDGGFSGTIISVTKVRVTVDLSLAKVYLSVFPVSNSTKVIKGVTANKSVIRHRLAQLTKNQLRKMPDLSFYLDDSLDYIERIERSLEGEENPLEQPELLKRRKKK